MSMTLGQTSPSDSPSAEQPTGLQVEANVRCRVGKEIWIKAS